MNKAFEKILERLEEKTIPVLDEDEHIIPESNIREPHEIEMVALSDVKKIIQEVSEEYNNGWISCSEIDKLPKDGTPVLVQDYEDYYEVYYCETKRGMKGFSDGDWWSSPNNYKAWQPLPEPYQPKGE